MTAFDEMMAGDGTRPPYAEFHRWLSGQPDDLLVTKSSDAEEVFRRTGITFAVYGEEQATERLIPFDILPRILSAAEWARLARQGRRAARSRGRDRAAGPGHQPVPA